MQAVTVVDQGSTFFWPELILSLRKFGLNPDDWTLKNINGSFIEIQHIDDPEFQMKGQIQNLDWSWLEFTSI